MSHRTHACPAPAASAVTPVFIRWQQAGFTLMEVLVVMAIIGILTSLAVPAYQRYTAQARLTSALSSLRSQELEVEQLLMSGASADQYAPEPSAPPYGTIAMTQEGDQPTLHYRFSAEAARGLASGEGKDAALHMTRSASGKWQCRAEGIEARLVPADCQP